MKVFLVVVCCFWMGHTASVQEKTKALESYFPLCKRDDSFNDCLKTNLQNSLPHLAKGAPELGVSPLDPWVEPEILIDYNNNNIVAHAVIKNIRSYGFSTITVNEVRSKLTDDTLDIEVDVKFPKIDQEGNFKGEGSVNTFSIKTKGYYNISMTGLTATWKIEGKKEVRGNEEYMRIEHFNMRPEVEKMKIYVSDLFPGNPELNQATNIALNENWKQIYAELLPYAEAYWDPAMTKIANSIFRKIPYKYLIPKP